MMLPELGGGRGVNSRPGLYYSLTPWRLNKASLYSRDASIRGNTVYGILKACFDLMGYST